MISDLRDGWSVRPCLGPVGAAHEPLAMMPSAEDGSRPKASALRRSGAAGYSRSRVSTGSHQSLFALPKARISLPSNPLKSLAGRTWKWNPPGYIRCLRRLEMSLACQLEMSGQGGWGRPKGGRAAVPTRRVRPHGRRTGDDDGGVSEARRQAREACRGRLRASHTSVQRVKLDFMLSSSGETRCPHLDRSQHRRLPRERVRSDDWRLRHGRLRRSRAERRGLY
jgi:hypothetical protein